MLFEYVFVGKQVHSDTNASEVDILGHFGKFKDILGHFGILWDNLEDFMTSLEHIDRFPSHFGPFSPIIGS